MRQMAGRMSLVQRGSTQRRLSPVVVEVLAIARGLAATGDSLVVVVVAATAALVVTVPLGKQSFIGGKERPCAQHKLNTAW
jgi:hypothetical protein